MKIWLETQLPPPYAESGGAHYGGRKWLVNFNAGKTQLVSFDRSNNIGAIDVKMDGSVLEEKPSFKMLGLNFSKLDWDSYIISIVLYEVSFP